MPTYVFHCKKCKKDFEIFQTLQEYSGKVDCPSCTTPTEHRIYTVVPGHVVLGDNDIKIGHLAKRNRDRMSDDKKRELARKHNEYKYTEVEKELPKGVKERKRKNPHE
jgi:putative FmdB family regulatory protein